MEKHSNNFDFLRVFAAILVIFTHAYGVNGYTPLLGLYTNNIYEGTIAVYIFFAISGYLIPKSYLSRNDWRQYLKARLLRIIPGLAVAVLLCVFVLGPLVTNLSMADYFSDRHTWTYLKNMVPVNIQYRLPGVFQHNNYGVNGSLWSIKIELRAYAIVMVLGLMHLLRYRYVILALWVVLYLGYVGWLPITIKDHIFYLMFLSGSVFFFFEQHIPLKGWVAACSFILLVTSVQWHGLDKLFPLCGTYLVMYVAYVKTGFLHHTAKYGDFSYGLYIYAFPIQQLFTHMFGGKMNPLLNFAMTVPVCLVFAILSWHLVEKPALSLKDKPFKDWLKRKHKTELSKA